MRVKIRSHPIDADPRNEAPRSAPSRRARRSAGRWTFPPCSAHTDSRSERRSDELGTKGESASTPPQPGDGRSDDDITVVDPAPYPRSWRPRRRRSARRAPTGRSPDATPSASQRPLRQAVEERALLRRSRRRRRDTPSLHLLRSARVHQRHRMNHPGSSTRRRSEQPCSLIVANTCCAGLDPDACDLPRRRPSCRARSTPRHSSSSVVLPRIRPPCVPGSHPRRAQPLPKRRKLPVSKKAACRRTTEVEKATDRGYPGSFESAAFRSG